MATAHTDLRETFERLRRRHTRLTRGLHRAKAEVAGLTGRRGKMPVSVARDRVGYGAIWSRWSQSYDDVATVADRLVRSQPESLTDLLGMYRALEWILITDGVIVDRMAERQVRRFGRGLQRLTAARS